MTRLSKPRSWLDKSGVNRTATACNRKHSSSKRIFCRRFSTMRWRWRALRLVLSRISASSFLMRLRSFEISFEP